MTNTPRSSIPYRPDIDGLRAWAVMLVVVYHAKLLEVPGGFVGVDVFFVISGYLITNIIATETDEGRFSIWGFYERRFRRIIPALAVMVLAVLGGGAIWLLPMSLERVSESGLAAMLFYANVHFWSTSANYFAPASETDPFLHTWSLAVEEQFYLFFPLFFALIFRLGRRRLLIAMAITGAASFSLMLTVYDIAPTATFFLPVTRAWEFLVGSLLALGIFQKPSNRGLASAGSLTGLALILTGALVFDSSMAFPGWVTLFPVLGTALVIHCADRATNFARIPFELKAIRQIGLISYSLYLWHWPILVLAEHYAINRPLSASEAVVCVTISFAAAFLSYHFIEGPFRRASATRGSAQLVAGATPLAAAAVALAAVSLSTDGLAMRHPDFNRAAFFDQQASEGKVRRAVRNDCFVRRISGREVDGCYIGPRGTPNTMIWGDSFAQHYLPALIEHGRNLEGRGLISLASPQCPPIIGYDPVNLPACKDINDQAVAIIDKMAVDTVILSANWFSYGLVGRVDLTDIANTVAYLQDLGVKVVLLGQSPVFSYTAPEEALFASILRDTLDNEMGMAPNGVPAALNFAMQVEITADAFLDPSKLFCSGKLCRFHDGASYLFRDYGHVTLEGGKRVAGPLMEVVFSVIRTNY